MEGHASWGMAGNRNTHKLRSNRYGILPVNYPFCIGHGGNIGFVDDPRGTKMLRIPSRVRHVIFVTEKNVPNPTFLFK